MKNIKIVIVEDDLYYNKALTKYVQTICNEKTYSGLKFEICSYLNAHDCIEAMDDSMDIMILDYFLVNHDEEDVLTGEDVLKELKTYAPNCKVIVVSAQQSASKTAHLMRNGIYDYVDKNVSSKNRVGALLQKLLRTEFLQPA